MKIIVRILLASLFVYAGLKFLLPHNAYPIEHFEQTLINFFPFSWKLIAIFSRILVGLLFVIAFLLLLHWGKIKWMKYFSVLMISIPFIINPVFLENFKDNTQEYIEDMSFTIQESAIETVLIYVSPNCLHCKEALIKLKTAKKKSSNFPEIIVISYNLKIQEFMNEENINLKLETIPADLFLAVTKGTFPTFELVKDYKILKKWSNPQFNYAVLDNLSK